MVPETPLIVDDLPQFFSVLPPDLLPYVTSGPYPTDNLLEVILDLGRPAVIRWAAETLTLPLKVTQEDLDYLTAHVGDWGGDNRAGIPGTLHRISCIRNRRGKIVGATCRVGRCITGTITPIMDLITSGSSILLLGAPGRGKTTRLREAARVLADECSKRVVVIDTSNEIGGDGDLVHPAIGSARRMQVPHPDRQYETMLEAVSNHFPQVIIIDELGDEKDVAAARKIAERGVQLIATAHGNTLEDVLRNPELQDVLGGIESVILGDAEAKRRGSQKSVRERKQPPTFDVLIEIADLATMIVHKDVAAAVDAVLREQSTPKEIRRVSEAGKVTITQDKPEQVARVRVKQDTAIKLYVYDGISKDHVDQALRHLGGTITLVRQEAQATHLLTTKRIVERHAMHIAKLCEEGVEILTVRTNSYAQILTVLKGLR